MYWNNNCIPSIMLEELGQWEQLEQWRNHNPVNDLFEPLSSWKKWHNLLAELKEKNWFLIVNYLRSISKTPDQIAKILRHKNKIKNN